MLSYSARYILCRTNVISITSLTLKDICVEHSDISGAEGIRTPDLLLAKQALSRLSYSPNANYCIKYCVVAKALPFFVCGIAVILRGGYIDAKYNLLDSSRRGDFIIFITLYFTTGSDISGQHSRCIGPYSGTC